MCNSKSCAATGHSRILGTSLGSAGEIIRLLYSQIKGVHWQPWPVSLLFHPYAFLKFQCQLKMHFCNIEGRWWGPDAIRFGHSTKCWHIWLMGLKNMGRSRGVTGAELLGEEQHPRLQLNQGDESWGAIVSSPDSYNCFSKSWRKGHLSLLFRGSTVYLSTVFVCWGSHKGQNQCLEPFLMGTGHVSSMHDFIESRNNLWPS